MNNGPSATLGIMFSVTNSGSNSRLSSGDQQNSTASATPTKAPSAKPPRISTAVTARLESHAYFADASVATVANGDGSTNFGTWKASTRTCQSTITARCTIRMIARDRAERIPSLDTMCSLLALFLRLASLPSAADLASLSRIVPSFNQLVDYCIGSSLRANGSRDCAPDDKLREAIHATAQALNGLLRRFAPRNDGEALRPQCLQDQVDHVFAAGALGGRAGQVAAEDRRQRGRIGKEEIAEARDGDVEMHRVDALAKGSGPHALFENFRDHADQR